MKQTFFIAVVNREYKGESAFNIVSPICKDKEQAVVFLKNEKSDFEDEFDNPWEVNEEKEDNFYLSDNHNYNIWGWIQEVEVETDFTGHRFGYTILSTQHIDGADDNDELDIQIVFTDRQSDRDEVYEAVDKIVERFKTENPSEEYGESSENRLIEDWYKEVGFENDDTEGDLSIWFELHDVI